jgi:hypothetical protein
MAMNLDPALEALEAQPVRGALVRLDRDARSLGSGATDMGDLGTMVTGGPTQQAVLQFQFNPETLTRTRAGQWDPRLKRQGQKIPPTPEVRSFGGMGSSALLAESEQISFKIVFDATEAILAGGRPEATTVGVLPQLAFLELISQGREGTAADDQKKDKTKESIQPIRPDELLLVLGASRLFPVVMTSLTITEQKFLPSFVPLRAEVELKLTVLEPIESRYSAEASIAFDELTRLRVARSAQHATTDSLNAAISSTLLGGPTP